VHDRFWSVQDDLLDQLRAAAAGHPGLRLVVIFGSRARGSANHSSDLDVAYDGSTDELELMERLGRVARCDVDLVRLDRADVILKNRIAREGIAIYELNPGTFSRFAADAALEYLDLEPLLLESRRRYLRRIGGGNA
jgi:predicted nucleotidyltransferase